MVDTITLIVAIVALIALIIAFCNMIFLYACRNYLHLADNRGARMEKAICNDMVHMGEALPKNISRSLLGAINEKSGKLNAQVSRQIGKIEDLDENIKIGLQKFAQLGSMAQGIDNFFKGGMFKGGGY